MNITPTTRHDFYCYGCGTNTAAKPRGMDCPSCGEPFSLRFLGRVSTTLFAEQPHSMWAYGELLPLASPASIISIDEGATPLVNAPNTALRAGVGEVLLKNETANPTGSFKDRQISVAISHAREIGADTVAVVSSGNVACSTAAYAARAGMKAVLFMHGHAAPGKIAQAAAYGATVVRVDSPSARAVFELCMEACRTFDWYHASTAGIYEPYNVEGAKTIAYELYWQTEGKLPDWIVAPVGGGGLLGGIWRGLLDLKNLGVISTLPRLAGVQASGCAPLKTAIEENQCFLDTLKTPWPNPKTVAGGIADDILFDGHTALPAIRTSNGVAVAVDDEAIIDAELALAGSEGILCDPCSAVTIAALSKLPDTTPDTRVCCVITGTGMKDLGVLQNRVAEPKTIEPSLDALRKALS
ncbi:MAG: threonine synthase [Candidatus Hydrogenedentes bacterium]|nr:threonine synthase [Candidatus Hydrogenedentota bacterium]